MSDRDNDGLRIALDSAPEYFLPGQDITGRLIVHSSSDVKTKGLSIALHGEVHISWSEKQRVRKSLGSLVVSFASPMRSNNPYEYRTNSYTAHETIMNISQPLLSKLQEVPSGDSSFPFSFRLPPDIPSSASCANGHIEYCLNAWLGRFEGIDWTTRTMIPVLAIFDLGPLTQLSHPTEFITEQESVRSCCGGKSAPIKLRCGLLKTGFYPGETIQFEVRIVSQRKKKMKSLSAKLVQHFTLMAEGHQRRATVDVAETTTTAGSGTDCWQGELLVPVCAPSGLGARSRVSQLISMHYTLNIVAEIKGCCSSSNPKMPCEVTIGFLPSEANADSSKNI